ncbi:MAG: hypothetical protein JRD04_12350 [Deltaproteobacteria bacterium]|nr:hypothetical protein [Deltaproteobacteria bacterium]
MPLNQIVMDCLFLLQKQAGFNDIKISTNLSEDLPMTYVDKDQIQQSIINLTLNALEATDPGGHVTFTTYADQESDMIHIDIIDTGRGIPKENLDKIFDPFFTTRETGTGLGLAITHGIIEQHGGKIKVDSTIGKGTRFTIMLPVRQGENNVA